MRSRRLDYKSNGLFAVSILHWIQFEVLQTSCLLYESIKKEAI